MNEDRLPKNGIDEAQVQALIQHYEDARTDGLCHEGAWEVALSKLPSLSLAPDLIQSLEALLH